MRRSRRWPDHVRRAFARSNAWIMLDPLHEEAESPSPWPMVFASLVGVGLVIAFVAGR